MFLAVLLSGGLYFYFGSETKTANKIDTLEEHKIMQELVRYDMADSLLKDPKELDISYNSVEFENLQDDIYIAEFLVNGEYKGKQFTWRVWKNTQEEPIWAYSSRECVSGCPDSEVFSTKDEMKTFMELHWLKMEHNRLVDECKCSNVAIKQPDLPIIEATDETKDYIKGVRGQEDIHSAEEQRQMIDDSIELIEEVAVELQINLLNEEAYTYFLKDLSRYLHFHLMRYDEVVKTYGIHSDEMIALNNEAEVYQYDEGGSYVGILSNIDYYDYPVGFEKEQSAYKELLVHVYRLYQFSWLHALYHDSTNEFLNDIDTEKKAIKSVYNNNKSIFEKYNLNKSLFNFESKTKEIEEYAIEKEPNTEKEIQKNEDTEEETDESKAEKPVAACGNGEALFTRSLNSHSITVHADNANFSNLQGGYAGGNEGDRIADGTFSLCVDSTQKLSIPVMSFNLERDHMVYALGGDAGLFVIEEYGTSNGNVAYLYTFNEGLLHSVNLETGKQGVFTGTKLKNSGPGMYQYMYYDNSTFSYFLYEIKITRTQASVVQYAEMADRTIYDQFTQDPNYIYTP
ncbi:hypothetical protein JMM81_06840 [Bacillus sp. V3B]|uniref:hypothetical protein n=1 Tax=Bacillus sp. V3B TaxID=2804915 RepID=UPI00210D8A72|nr:hypothetical protein [Bacillus sp. V3B]MCQ6274688.1 hypothetical protein [Bacillus sp. V3B]